MTKSSIEAIVGAIFAVVILFFVIFIPIEILTGHKPKDPTFSIESTTVKAYNLTSDDNKLFSIINLGVRASNPNTKKHTLDIYAIDMEVRKGKHHKLADDMFWGFVLSPGEDILVDVEAVGLHVGLEREIAAAVRADVVAGEGRVNLFMNGYVGSDHYLGVTCKNVLVDFSGSMVKVQKVDCGVSVTYRDRGGD